MKREILLFILINLVLISWVEAQQYGNEWIKDTQKYYKLSTAQDGLYRVTYNELLAAGFPVNSIDPRRIQLFHRGVEQAILVFGENDARFDNGDYIDFYGTRNDGTLDTALYVTPRAQPHKYYNFYSDTTAYFLTWRLSGSGEKRIQTFKENNILNLPAEPYHLNEIINLQTNAYSIGLHYPIGEPSAETYLSAFDYGEGWTGSAFTKGQFKDITFTGMAGAIKSGVKPVLEVLLIGGNNLSHTATISVGPNQSSLRNLGDTKFNYHYDTLVTSTLEWSDFSGDNLVCRVSIPDNGVADRLSISFARLVFADAWDQKSADQKIYHALTTNSNRSYLVINNVPAGSELMDITNIQNIINIQYNTVGTQINAMIPNDLTGRKLLLTSKRIQVPKMEAVSMRNIDPSEPRFLIITNKILRKPSSKYPDVPRAYAAYRASTAGGRFDTLVVNVDQLYNMFSYGEYSSLAIYNFCRFMADRGDPSYLFIMGKGLADYPNPGYRSGNPSRIIRDLIPSAGYPGNDALYTAGLNGSTYETGFPVGRVAAETPMVLEAYFDKVKEMEGLPHNALWRKELVHLSGGDSPYLQSLFRRYVDGMKSVADGEFLGGHVETISKKSNSATELINIAEYVNAGKMLITFFGHSGAFSADIEIGNVSDPAMGYQNAGKYPMMIVNGCNAGDMYNSGYGFGEDWIGTANKGAVGFIAHTGAGLTTRLKRYTDLIYEIGLTDTLFLDKGIGDIQKETGKRYLERYSNSELDIAQVQQMALQGDPAVRLFGATRPDYEINTDNIFTRSIDGQPISVLSESFNLGLIVQNFGRTDHDSLKVLIKRRVEETGMEYVLDTVLVKPVFYKDTLFIEIKTLGVDGFGKNTFTINLDPLNAVKELEESNNQVIYDKVFISMNGTRSLYPSNYSIVNTKEVKLAAQALDLLMENRSYLFELDTTVAFMSPIRREMTVQGNNLAKWTVDLFENLPEKDTVVFYWRTKFSDTTKVWSNSSFTYINNGVPGWAMAHFQQFDGNETKNVVLNEATRSWEFEQFETSIFVRTFGSEDTLYNYENVVLRINNTEYIFPSRLCTDNSMNLLAFDKSTTVPYLVLGNSFILDRTNCGRIPQVINNMLKSEIETKLNIEKYIDAMGDGDFVLLFSIGKVTFQTWPATTLTKLEEIGINASDIQNLTEGEPVIILGQKGSAPGSAKIIKADYSSPQPPDEQEIMLDQTITGQAVSGLVRSPRIGPAAKWISFDQKTRISESPVADFYSFNIYGVDMENKEQLLYENIQLGNVDLQSINVANYPYLKLEMNTTDEVNLTPAQLKNWFVLYEGFPEGVLSYKPGQEKTGIEKSEGETHEALFAFENISTLAFNDSLAIEYRLFNQDAGKSFIDTLRIKPLNPGEAVDFPLSLDTRGKTGKNDFSVFANPYIQTEQNFNNNYIAFSDYLTVNKDNTNPIMEVTVDGEFIMDGDIVSPSPVIVLRLKDDGSVLLKEDTVGVNLYLNEKCEGCTASRISFSSPNVAWTPATSESDFRVEFHPQSLADGIYTLKAEAADASGNPSGSQPYAVNFEIINESQITNFFPYPNPFSTRTQFVFTLTGSDIPDEIIIQIMTVNGTVVREITQDEIGPIKIGNNKTEYAWDGRDEYGDQLANGVYLYRVKIYNNGNEMKHRSTSADKAFKNGMGKMYLLR